MPTITVINPTTDAVLSHVQFNTFSYSKDVSFMASGLADAETITPYVGGSNGWTPMYNDAGEQIVLSADSPQLRTRPGINYGFLKSVSTGPVGLDAAVTC